MTSQQAQIQELIHAIDGVLNKTSPRLPWVMAGDADQQRQVLEQTRNYLASLQQQASAPGNVPPGYDPNAGYLQGYGQPSAPAESAQQVLQAVLQEMSYLRSNVMQPMRSDVEALRQERDALMREIKDLETQRQQYALPQVNQQQVIGEFLQSLMGRLQENLTGQVAQMVANLEAQSARDRALSGTADPNLAGDAAATYQPLLTPTERLEHLQRVQSQSDQLLLKLDSTLRVIFESLQSNVQTYQESLSQGLDKMHNLGHQGEAMFSALVNRLAQQLGKEASSYLQSSLQASEWEAANLPLPGTAVTPPDTSRQVPGAQPARSIPPAAQPSDEISDAQIDLLLDELRGEATVLQPPQTALQPDKMPAVDEDLVGLDLLNLELDNLDLASTPRDTSSTADDEELTIFQIDESALTRLQDDDELTFFQINEEATQFQLNEPDVSAEPGKIDNLDSALDLLNQISTDFQADTETAGSPANLAGAIASSENPYDELDEFYESMFGTGAISLDEEAEAPIDQHVADASQVAQVEQGVTGAIANQPASTDLDLENQLFAGLADLALEELSATEAASSDAADPNLDAPADELSPDAIESLLFDEPVGASDTGTIDLDETAFLEPSQTVSSELEVGAFEVPANADIISSLTDLISNPENQASNLETLRSEDTRRTPEEAYEPAAPDEDLLVTAENLEEPRVELRVDEDVLHRLTLDLSNLEGLSSGSTSESAPVETPGREKITAPTEEDDQTLLLGDADLSLQEDLEMSLDSGSQDVTLPLFLYDPDADFSDEAIAPTAEEDDGTDTTIPLTPSEDAAEEIEDISALLLADAALESSSAAPETAFGGAEPAARREELSLEDFLEVMGSESAAEPVDTEDLLAEPEITLPPGREDLSLADFQTVMTTPIKEDVEPATEVFAVLPTESDLVNAIPVPPADIEATLDNFFSTEIEETSEPAQSSRSFALEDMEPGDFAEPVPPPAPPEQAIATRIEDLFADVPETTAEAVEPPTQLERSAELDQLAALFADEPIDEEPIANAAPAPSSGVAGRLRDLGLTLESFAAEVGEAPAESSSTEAATPPEDANAFTLEGLGNLFEDLPPATPSAYPPPAGTGTQSNVTIDDIFSEVEPKVDEPTLDSAFEQPQESANLDTAPEVGSEIEDAKKKRP